MNEEEKEKYVLAWGEDVSTIFAQSGIPVTVEESATSRFVGTASGTLEGAEFHFNYHYQTVAEVRRIITKFFGTHQGG